MECIIIRSIKHKRCLLCSTLCCSSDCKLHLFVLLTKDPLYISPPPLFLCKGLDSSKHLLTCKILKYVGKKVIFLNILATGPSFSGNRCVIPINICIFSSCLLNSSHPNQHTCQARTCCNVCCKETTLGKLGLHRTCLSDEDTSTVPAVKQFFTGNIKLQAVYRHWTKFV